MAQRYKKMGYGVVTYYGDTEDEEEAGDLDESRHRFQNDENTQILIATYDTGAVGVTFTAADAVLLYNCRVIMSFCIKPF